MDTSEEFKGGNYLSIDTTKDTDIATLLTGGTIEEMKDFNGKLVKKRNIPVRIGETDLVWTPWPKDGRALQKAFGVESENWAGKKIQVFHVDKKLVIRPIVEEKA